MCGRIGISSLSKVEKVFAVSGALLCRENYEFRSFESNMLRKELLLPITLIQLLNQAEKGCTISCLHIRIKPRSR